MRKLFVAVPIALLAVGGSTACASKKFVRTSVGEVNDKVDSLGRSVEETQERTRRNEGRLSEVDQKAIAAAEQIMVRAQEASAQERTRMLAELRSQFGRLVVETTASVTGKILTAEDQQRLAEETAKQLTA